MSEIPLEQKRSAFEDRLRRRSIHPPGGAASIVLQMLAYPLLILFTFLMLGPFLWCLITSFLTRASIFAMEVSLDKLTGSNYIKLFTETDILRWYLNTVIVTVAIVVSVAFLSSVGGYVFATKEFPGKKLFFALILLFLMVPVQVILIPLFLEMRWFGLTDTYLGLILPYAGSTFGVFLITQYMKTIPPSLIAAAKIDGASEYRIIFQIMIPLCLPALASLSIIKFVFSWNDFIWPLVVIRSKEMRTLPLGVALMHGHQMSDWNLIMSAVIVSIIPVVILILSLQRYFIRGVASSGIK
jgi:ABC-type glycerol-3-phosphate transport system permease component